MRRRTSRDAHRPVDRRHVGSHPMERARRPAYRARPARVTESAERAVHNRRVVMGTLLLVILVLLLLGSFPTWPHSKNWGYYPSGGLGLVLLIVVVLVISGRI